MNTFRIETVTREITEQLIYFDTPLYLKRELTGMVTCILKDKTVVIYKDNSVHILNSSADVRREFITNPDRFVIIEPEDFEMRLSEAHSEVKNLALTLQTA